MLNLILLVAAVVRFGLAAVGVPAGRVNLIGAGLFCLALGQLVSTVRV